MRVINVTINLEEKRLEKGMSIRTLAEQSGVSRATITRIESGKSNPTVEVLCKLVSALGITLEDLIQYGTEEA